MVDQGLEKNLLPGKFDYITPFYNQYHNNKSLVEGLDSLLNTSDLSVKSIPFSSDMPPVKLFPGIQGKSRQIKVLKKYDGVQLLRMTHRYKEDNELKEEEGNFFILEHPDYRNVYVLLTIESNNFFKRSILPLFDDHTPHMMMTFITHKRLKRFLEEFQEENQFSKLTITHASHRCRFNEKGKSEKVFPGISWFNMDLNEAFNWVYQNNGWFQSLQFKVKAHHFPGAEVSITRQGIVRTTRLFSKVFKSFILPVCKMIHENNEFFGNRSRRDNLNLAARPLTIDFGMDQFSESSENSKFIQSLRRLNKVSISVLHGNPYIHLSIIDYFDGSTFDLWVLNSNQLFIVPQMRGSVSSIKRLINHIFDTYAEGDIKDYREESIH
ncbi:MAG: hypothetical protein QG657_323 [Acidobacteriota bacterium]|nr:hypothetical protein [Acidobacteriota bacterium]